MKRWVTALACLIVLAGPASAQMQLVPVSRIELDNERIIIEASDWAGIAFAVQSAKGMSVGLIPLLHAKAFTDSMRLIAGARLAHAPGARALLSASGGNVSVSRTVRDSSDTMSVSIDGSKSSSPSVRIAASPSLLAQLADAVDSAARRSLELTGPERAAKFAQDLARIEAESARTQARPSAQQQASAVAPLVYFEFQVAQAATPMSDNPAPAYPDMLRAAKTEGSVLAQFVVDTAGVPEPSTFKVLKSSHVLFTQAVKDVVPRLRFTPAQLGGRKVFQLVQMPFTFQLDR